MKKLVVYYSYTGNTKKLAKIIAEKIGAETLEIETETPYSDDYDLVVENAKVEIRKKATPKLIPLKTNVDNYDLIVLGTPVWWYSMAPATRSFLTENALKDKKVYVFATNGGWLGHTFEDIKKLCPNAKFEEMLNVEFDEDVMRTSEKKVEEFINKIKA